ncbi:MAG: YerC/YecD family TrpR-related protein [Phascolarctobacterium sp.]|nr:YerC/YecD family TrpR-related protein [Phascolarctobacterium sp.]
MDKIRTAAVESLLQVITELQTVDESYAFLSDVCTIKELQDMAQRLQTAKLLQEGKSYQEITEKVGASAATISRVNRCLNYGPGGYAVALERLKADK